MTWINRRSSLNGVSSGSRYNMAPFTWVAGSNGCCEVSVRGLRVQVSGDLYDADTKQWSPMALLCVRPPSCMLNLSVTEADVGGLAWSARNSRGRIVVNGETRCGAGVQEPDRAHAEP